MITALVIISSIAIGLKKNIDKYIIIIINAYQIYILYVYMYVWYACPNTLIIKTLNIDRDLTVRELKS